MRGGTMRYGDKPGYSISFEDRKGYLYAFVKGDGSNPGLCRKYLGDIAQACASRDYARVLIDSALEGKLTVTQIYHLVAGLPGMGFHGIKIALFERFADHHADNLFGQTTAANRGLRARVFLDVEEAER